MPINYNLKKLLHNCSTSDIPENIQISGMTQDSRLVKPGNLFCACPGEQKDGRKFISEAASNGAIAIAVDVCAGEEIAQELKDSIKIPFIPVYQLRQKLGMIASRYYDEPSKKMKVFGVTGTNGKTSVSHFLAEAGQNLGFKSAVVGTLGYGSLPSLKHTQHTTPDAIQLQSILAELYAQNITWVAMEVSSHGLEQGRVNGITFDTAIFTNISRDHLDYHGTMEAYQLAKAKLFNMPDLKHAVINADDEFGWELIQTLQQKLSVYPYSGLGKHLGAAFPMLLAPHSNFNFQGMTAGIHSPWGTGVLHSSFMGRFYLSNLLAVLATLCIQGVNFEDVLGILARLSPVPGRMQMFGGSQNQARVIVDYAHTPDALKQVLLALREHTEGNIWCVFGCGGDRDTGKRPQMGAIAESYADYIILTDDNPRTEDPLKIILDIKSGFTDPSRTVIEHDRFRAIEHAIDSANHNDVVLIAGKGHENYQQIGQEKRPFSDALTVQMILAEKGS